MHEHDNHRELVAEIGMDISEDAIKQNTVVIVVEVAAKLEQRKTIKSSHCLDNEKNKLLQRTVRYLPAEEDLYLLLSFMIPIPIIIYI